uniref:Uncharacterized protein n=1 Tax=Ixodes ricinus TaxID=34613 RepID=A0A6B0UBQ0_IXORI
MSSVLSFGTGKVCVSLPWATITSSAPWVMTTILSKWPLSLGNLLISLAISTVSVVPKLCTSANSRASVSLPKRMSM